MRLGKEGRGKGDELADPAVAEAHAIARAMGPAIETTYGLASFAIRLVRSRGCWKNAIGERSVKSGSKVAEEDVGRAHGVVSLESSVEAEEHSAVNECLLWWRSLSMAGSATAGVDGAPGEDWKEGGGMRYALTALCQRTILVASRERV
jgi:hypothetical protein